MSGIKVELPLYRCHKVVRAARIEAVDFGERLDLMPFGVAEVGKAWIDKHQPQPGGYFVEYADGYTSYSPARAFLDGYTLVHGDAAAMDDPMALGDELNKLLTEGDLSADRLRALMIRARNLLWALAPAGEVGT